MRSDGHGDPLGLKSERGISEDEDDANTVAPGGVQEGAARLLAHMAFRDDMRDAIREAGAVPNLVALLKEGDTDAQVHRAPLDPAPGQLRGESTPFPLLLSPLWSE